MRQPSGGEAAPTRLAEIAPAIDWPDPQLAAEAQDRLKTGGTELGRLGDLARWYAAARGEVGRPPRRSRLIAIGATRPAGPAGAADPLAAVVAGTRGPGVATDAALGVRTVDVAGLRARGGDDPATIDPAAEVGGDDPAAIAAAIAAGVEVVDAEVDAGADLLVVAVLGGAEVFVSATTLLSVCTMTEPIKLLPRGAGWSPQTWIRRAELIRDMRHRAIGLRGAGEELLACLAAPELAAAAAVLIRAAGRRTPVIIDGLGAAAAAVLAAQLTPGITRWWQAADRGSSRALHAAWDELALQPILQLGLGLDDGTGGALAVEILRAATRLS